MGRPTLGQVLDLISERSPPGTGLQHPRQHPDIHVDRAIGDAAIVTCALDAGDAVAVNATALPTCDAQRVSSINTTIPCAGIS
jgi:hypothetical protein